jgi:Tfp pilus assembly protein PilF
MPGNDRERAQWLNIGQGAPGRSSILDGRPVLEHRGVGMDDQIARHEFRASMRVGDYHAAFALAERALATSPQEHQGRWHKDLALAALMLKRHELAYRQYGLALATRMPFAADDFYNFGLCCNELGYYTESIDHYRRSLQLNPDSAPTHNNIGKSMNRIGLLAEAEAHLRKALELEPGRATSELNLATNLLLRGNWQAGWKYYEARLRVFSVIPEMPYPRWDGTPRRSRVLLLRTEQGMGDAIQFARFAVLLGRAGVPTIIQAQPRLVALLRTLSNVRTVIGHHQKIETKVPIEWAPLMSVPYLTGLVPKRVPSADHYLTAEPDRVAHWKNWLPDGAFTIGIAWQGNPQGDIDRGRSFPLAALAPIAALPGVRLISLQKDAGADQIAGVPFRERLLIPGADFDRGDDAFLDTAALMMSLDLVITCDTSIAHLAGALGRPTFLALQKWPDWRWLLEREDTPWYPRMRLFRQHTAGDWEDVLARIATAVTDTMGAGAG